MHVIAAVILSQESSTRTELAILSFTAYESALHPTYPHDADCQMSFSDDPNQPLPPDFLTTLTALESNDDIVSWINSTLEPSGEASSELGTLDRHVSRLVASLDVASEDVSLQLEHLIEDISRSATRLHYDLHFMRDGALSLQGSLNSLTASVNNSFSPETTAALDKLHSLDIIKTNMEAARDVLREAESWSTLESEVSSLLVEQNYEKAAEKLSEANKSMIVFQNTADYEHRRALMVSLQNQLEASLSSALISAINSNDVVVCRAYYAIFDNIQRDAEFRTYYHGSRRGGLVAMWQEAHLSDTGEAAGAGPALPLSAFLTSFFTSFLTTLNTEKGSISAIFPDPQATLSTFITSTLTSLQPTFAQRLSALSNHLGPSALTELIAAFKAAESFAVSADKILERTGPTNALSPTLDAAEPPTPRIHRRRSSRLSISRRIPTGGNLTGRALSGSGLDWDHELFEPFLELQVEYGGLETRFLAATLPAATDTAQSDQAHTLRERSVDVFSLAEESLGRMLAFTHGYGAASLVQTLDMFFQTFVDDSRRAFAAQAPSARPQPPASNADGDLSDLDYSLEDWSHIQAWLHLLESLRIVLDRMGAFEAKLRMVLMQIATSFRSDPDGGLPYVPGTTRGEITLLAQSELNTMQLQNLLKEAEPDSRPPSQDPTSRHSLDKGVLALARASIATYTTVCQTALQDAMLSPLRKHLTHYATSALWTTVPTEPKSRRGASNEAQVPTFSLSPSEVIQHVAEGLLNLPRLFEVYQDDDVLAFSLSTLPFVDTRLLESLAEQAEAAHGPAHGRRQSVALMGKPAPPVASPQAFSPEAIESVWLSSLGRALLAHLTTVVLPKIKTLTPSGAAQLASDLSYLTNIVGALNAESEDLERWREYAALSDEDGRRSVSEGPVSDGVFSAVARIRGWLPPQM